MKKRGFYVIHRRHPFSQRSSKSNLRLRREDPCPLYILSQSIIVLQFYASANMLLRRLKLNELVNIQHL